MTAWTHWSLCTRLTSAWRMPSSICFTELTHTWRGHKARSRSRSLTLLELLTRSSQLFSFYIKFCYSNCYFILSNISLLLSLFFETCCCAATYFPLYFCVTCKYLQSGINNSACVSNLKLIVCCAPVASLKLYVLFYLLLFVICVDMYCCYVSCCWPFWPGHPCKRDPDFNGILSG